MVQRTFLVIVFILVSLCVFAQELIPAEEVSADSLKPLIPYEDITAWIDKEMGDNPFRDEILPVSYMDIYGAAYHAVGMDSQTKSYDYHDFEAIPGIFSNTLYLRDYLDFFAPDIKGKNLSLRNHSYTQPILLTGVNAGLGDYEFNFVKIAVRKNEILSFPGFYYSGDFLGQRGLWTGIDHAQSAQKQYLSLRLGKFVVDAEYATWALDASSQDLLPVYWQSLNFLIDHKLTKLWSKVSSPFIDLSVLHTTEKALALTEGLNSNSKTTQVMAAKTLDLGEHHLTAGYEHAFTDLDYTSKQTWGGRLYEDKLRLNYLLLTDWGLDADVKTALYDWEDMKYDIDISMRVNHWKAGLYGASAPQELDIDYIDIFAPADTVQLAHSIVKSDFGAYLEGSPTSAISFRTGFAIPHYKYRAGGHNGSNSGILPETRIFYADSIGKFGWILDQYLYFNPFFTIQSVPRIRYQLRLELVRDMDHDNAIFAGLSLRGHTQYDLINEDETEIGGSSILDLWAGIKITKLFDLTVALKNAGDSDIFGTYPIPRTLHASVRWVFVN